MESMNIGDAGITDAISPLTGDTEYTKIAISKTKAFHRMVETPSFVLWETGILCFGTHSFSFAGGSGDLLSPGDTTA
jgi:hypothetical protein